MMTRRSWKAARRSASFPLLVGLLLLLARRRSGLVAVGAAGAALLFFRDPARSLDADPEIVYAAADGRVTHVGVTDDPWVAAGDSLRISTFLSLHDVHVNRSPVGGTITQLEELPGRYLPAFFSGSVRQNRQNRLAIDGPKVRVVVVQIAGIAARKISRWVDLGEIVAPGQRIGLIHFGSRTDVLLPAGTAVPLVRRGDRVRAGVTPLARYGNDEKDEGWQGQRTP